MKLLQVILLCTLFLTSSCQEKQSVNDSQSSEATVKPPKVDIHTAVISGDLAALKQHIAAGSNLNEKDPFGGSSPLITAAVFGKPEAAKILIDAGADLDFQNNDGSTALHSSAFFCWTEIVELLIEKGADKSIKNKFESTAYESVSPPFADVKNIYEMMKPMLSPMGLNLDFDYIEKTRPLIAELLK